MIRLLNWIFPRNTLNFLCWARRGDLSRRGTAQRLRTIHRNTKHQLEKESRAHLHKTKRQSSNNKTSADEQCPTAYRPTFKSQYSSRLLLNSRGTRPCAWAERDVIATMYVQANTPRVYLATRRWGLHRRYLPRGWCRIPGRILSSSSTEACPCLGSDPPWGKSPGACGKKEENVRNKKTQQQNICTRGEAKTERRGALSEGQKLKHTKKGQGDQREPEDSKGWRGQEHK